MRRALAAVGVATAGIVALWAALPRPASPPAPPAAPDASAPPPVATGATPIRGPVVVVAQSRSRGEGAAQQALPPSVLVVGQRGGRTRIEHERAQAVHGAFVLDGVLWTLGADASPSSAPLERWWPVDGGWAREVVWRGAWAGGRFNRLVDAVVAELDGERALVIGTADQGVVAIGRQEGPGWRFEELAGEPGVEVRSVAVGEVDGRPAIWAAVAARPTAEGRAGAVWRHVREGDRWRGEPVWTASQGPPREVRVLDLDGDGVDEVVVVRDGVRGKPGEPRRAPTGILRLRDGVEPEVLAAPDDDACRSSVVADVDGDGREGLVVGCDTTGLWHLHPEGGALAWTVVDAGSRGFEHAVAACDLDEDGRDELLVASDHEGELVMWRQGAGGALRREVLAPLADADERTLSWSVSCGVLR